MEVFTKCMVNSLGPADPVEPTTVSLERERMITIITHNRVHDNMYTYTA